MRACTIIARNYLAYARVLAESFLAHHPDSTLSVFVLDAEGHAVSDADEPFDVIRVGELDLALDEYHRMAAIYDVMEIATAIKPWLLRRLLRKYREPVLYLDPDIEVFGSLVQVLDAAERYEIVLTPHTLRPMPRDGQFPSEIDILLAGAYNLGFICVGPRSFGFLDWWQERLRRECVNSVEQGLFVDQRWIDLAVHYFETHSIADETYNVAYWNIDRRDLTCGNHDDYQANGKPLTFFHFSGFNPHAPHQLSRHQRDRPRMRPTDNPALAQICRQYADRLLAAGYDEHVGTAYGYDIASNGVTLTRHLRRLYRRDLVAAEAAGRLLPPDPFDPRAEPAFATWSRDAVRRGLVSNFRHQVTVGRGGLARTLRNVAFALGRRG